MSHSPVALAREFMKKSSADESSFHMSSAVAYGIDKEGKFSVIGSQPDVYDLLDSVEIPAGGIGVAVHTTGWAAPLNEEGEPEGAPSQHPQRRRVQLLAVIAEGKAGSALAFADEPDDVIVDEGGATGSLADALLEVWERSL